MRRRPYNNIILNFMDKLIRSHGLPNIMIGDYVSVVGEPPYFADGLCSLQG